MFDARKTRVVVALSGGVDSSVVTAIARQEDFEPIAATLRLRHPDPAFSSIQTCANKSDEEAIKLVCQKLNVEHHYLDLYRDFECAVLRPAAEAYLQGRTPNPCCQCNPTIKFGKLLEFADAIGASYVLTGHYARTEEIDGKTRLLRGIDSAKDQTYFLYRLTPDMLAKIVFPLGEFTKSQVRELAADLDLPTASRHDSQDACFQAPNECFGETLRRLFELPRRPGNFIYQGRVVGHHDGIHQYTLGQRKGLRVALGQPAYIQAIEPATGDIILTLDEADLECKKFTVKNCVWHQDLPPEQKVLAQIRYRSKPVAATLFYHADTCRAVFETPQRAVTPGQSAVFYDGDLLLGGGVIDEI